MTVEVQSDSPSLSEAIFSLVDARLRSVHTSVPGYIESYDVTTQTASVRLPILESVTFADGSELTEAHPVLIEVPLGFPRMGVGFLHFPVAKNDAVYVLFAERSLAKFLASTSNQNVDPVDRWTHDLSDAVAIPASVYPLNKKITNISEDDIHLGRSDSDVGVRLSASLVKLGSASPVNSVAMAEKVIDHLSSISAELNKIITAVNALPGLSGTAVPVSVLFDDIKATKAKVD